MERGIDLVKRMILGAVGLSGWVAMTSAKTASASLFSVGMPLAASDIAQRYDTLWGFVFWLSVFFAVLVIGGMLFLGFKYRASRGAKAKYIEGNHLIEIVWTAIPTVILLGIFTWGYVIYRDMAKAPADAMEIRGIGKQWLWTFQYDFGRATVAELVVPINKPIKVLLSSEDVLHGFFIPNMRVKSDVVPGMYTSVWFEANVPGKHVIFCTAYCGTSHSQMMAYVYALPQDEFDRWKLTGKLPHVELAQKPGEERKLANDDPATLAPAAPLSLAEQGKVITETKGCVACHNTDPTAKMQGPTYYKLYGSEVELADGSKVIADDNYIAESIKKPTAKIVKGYNPIMPTFQGLLSESEINAVIAYIKTIK